MSGAICCPWTNHDGYFASRVYGSGAQAILTAAEQIISGHGRMALAGGGENFSRGPYVMTGACWGMKRGPGQVIDTGLS